MVSPHNIIYVYLAFISEPYLKTVYNPPLTHKPSHGTVDTAPLHHMCSTWDLFTPTPSPLTPSSNPLSSLPTLTLPLHTCPYLEQLVKRPTIICPPRQICLDQLLQGLELQSNLFHGEYGGEVPWEDNSHDCEEAGECTHNHTNGTFLGMDGNACNKRKRMDGWMEMVRFLLIS